MPETSRRDRQIQRIILIEGAANVLVLIGKVIAGLSTGSLSILGDAIHSLVDVANNVIAWGIVKLSSRPADRDHPYGHRKFETLAVFGLATLLVVLALELAIHALTRHEATVEDDPWMLLLMIAVLCINTGVAAWQRYWAKRLKSDILAADASHTFADALTTVAVIIGWQLSTRGYPWLDTVFALGVAAFVLYLAYGLFRRALPTLVDEAAIEPRDLSEAVLSVEGVRGVGRIRSRWVDASPFIDMVVFVSPNLSTTESHAIADDIEQRLEERFQARDISIHIEPDPEAA
ncbi:MAG: cation diffusion facilitator family transporter [Alphaproteobacteria bacterium]|nr:cation diffusion facilitator family transporter [Alphaproteobacteria bacterium]